MTYLIAIFRLHISSISLFLLQEESEFFDSSIQHRIVNDAITGESVTWKTDKRWTNLSNNAALLQTVITFYHFLFPVNELTFNLCKNNFTDRVQFL